MKKKVMTIKKNEMDGLFDLLKIYFPNDPRCQNKVLKNAWMLVLEAYETHDVKRALVAHLQSSKQFPFVQEIAMRCGGAVKAAAPSPATRATSKQDRWVLAYHRLLETELAKFGLPNSVQAQADGMSHGQWHRMAEEAGVDFEALLAESLAEAEVGYRVNVSAEAEIEEAD